MRRFLIIFMVCLFIMPTCLAAKSKTTKDVITVRPSTIKVRTVDDLCEADMFVAEYIDEVETYELIEALLVKLDRCYELTEWRIPGKFNDRTSVKVVITNLSNLVIRDCFITGSGTIIVDFTELEPDDYYIYFYIKQLKNKLY